MTKLTEFVQNYEPQVKTKLISDLQEVSTDIDIVEDSFNLQNIYNEGLTPRKAADAIARKIYDLN